MISSIFNKTENKIVTFELNERISICKQVNKAKFGPIGARKAKAETDIAVIFSI